VLLRKPPTNDLGAVWRWFEFQRDLNAKELNYSLKSLVAPTGDPPPVHIFQSGTTPAEVRDFFAGQNERLELMVMLEIVVATEGILRVNFLQRTKRKDDLSRGFRAVYKQARQEARLRSGRLKIRLDKDILEAIAGGGINVSEFRGALKLRNWLAHGRCWTPKLGHNYTPEEVFDICSDLTRSLGV
jgi:hypothetical protein